MKIIIWLWNPWDKYKSTRHNIWFMFLDYFSEKDNFSEFKYESKFKANISSWFFLWKKIILVKPKTFMNLSWESVQKIIHFYKIKKRDFIVIYDDISMDFWKIRFRKKWSAWWHNWIKDIIRFYWNEFSRIKIWVWLDKKYEVSDWVLSKFKEEELIDLENKIFWETYKLLEKKL
jgi:PTH1 family peptidyl-tRNA hydrolase